MTSRDRVALNAKCEVCHEEPSQQWRLSLHHKATTNPRFQRGFAREPLEWCVRCHAPSFNTQEPVREASDLGVSCIDCHKADERQIAAGRLEEHRNATSASREPASTCSTCHEFPFPKAPSVAMQRTVSEHAQSRFAATSCASCHMPSTATRSRDHRFAVSDEMIRTASHVSVTPMPRGVAFDFAQGHVGHAFPTGDTFRRVRLEAEAMNEHRQVVERQSRILSRRMPKGGSSGRSDVEDDRLFLSTAHDRVELSFQRPHRSVRYRVLYERAESESEDSSLPTDAVELLRGSFTHERSP
jgi:hypothetical protein